MRAANKRPTWTHLVTEALRVADDFMNRQQLMAATGGSHNQISAALHHLQKMRVVDAVEAQGTPYWFLTDEDLRQFEQAERTPEEKPRRTRRLNKLK